MAGAAALVHVRAHRWQGTPFDVQIWQLLVALRAHGRRWPSSSSATSGRPSTGTWAALLVVLYSGALATAFAFWASQSIVRAIGPTTTSIGYLAVPVAGIITGVLVLGEPVGPLDILGLLVTSAGIVVVLRAPRRASAGRTVTGAPGLRTRGERGPRAGGGAARWGRPAGPGERPPLRRHGRYPDSTPTIRGGQA